MPSKSAEEMENGEDSNLTAPLEADCSGSAQFVHILIFVGPLWNCFCTLQNCYTFSAANSKGCDQSAWSVSLLFVYDITGLLKCKKNRIW